MSKLKQESLSSPFMDRIDYTLTACLYCWYIWVAKIGIAVQNNVLRIIRQLVSFFLPKRYYKLCRNQVKGKKDLDILFRNLETGDDIRTAKDLVFFTCCGYLSLPMALISCIICSLIGWFKVMDWMREGVGGIVIPLILTLSIIFAVSKLTNTSGDSNFYLPYFKEFNKMDEKWHEKWKRNTILLFAGSLLSFIICIEVCFLCVTVNRNIHGSFN